MFEMLVKAVGRKLIDVTFTVYFAFERAFIASHSLLSMSMCFSPHAHIHIHREKNSLKYGFERCNTYNIKRYLFFSLYDVTRIIVAVEKI